MTFGVIKWVKATSNDAVTFLGQKLCQLVYKGHRDYLGHKVGHGDL